MKPQRPRLRWGLTLLVLHILVLFITAAPYRKLSRKQGAPAIKADDVSHVNTRKSSNFCFYLISRFPTIRPVFACSIATVRSMACTGPRTWTRASR